MLETIPTRKILDILDGIERAPLMYGRGYWESYIILLGLVAPSEEIYRELWHTHARGIIKSAEQPETSQVATLVLLKKLRALTLG